MSALREPLYIKKKKAQQVHEVAANTEDQCDLLYI